MAWFKTVKPGNVVTAPPVVAEIEYGLNRLKKSSRKYQLLVVEKERLLGVISVSNSSWNSRQYDRRDFNNGIFCNLFQGLFSMPQDFCGSPFKRP